MPYRYLDFATADVAFLAEEMSLEELFKTSGDALMNVMIEDLATIQFKKRIPIQLENKQLDLLLFDFLQEFIYFKDAEQLLLRAKDVKIQGAYSLAAILEGEPLDPDRHTQGVDVKAVTLHQYEVSQKNGLWTAHVILDI